MSLSGASHLVLPKGEAGGRGSHPSSAGSAGRLSSHPASVSHPPMGWPGSSRGSQTSTPPTLGIETCVGDTESTAQDVRVIHEPESI